MQAFQEKTQSYLQTTFNPYEEAMGPSMLFSGVCTLCVMDYPQSTVLPYNSLRQYVDYGWYYDPMVPVLPVDVNSASEVIFVSGCTVTAYLRPPLVLWCYRRRWRMASPVWTQQWPIAS